MYGKNVKILIKKIIPYGYYTPTIAEIMTTFLSTLTNVNKTYNIKKKDKHTPLIIRLKE